ncbi:protein odd-skipped-related 1 [Folsomia candida]|uniref:protein odd-skipped-related 1 n=1 Tax=Folsomia candida TaxID=158441 RepID=UPI000B8EFB39|nr:protein odd-skipped-related 1 [Folsomia candida]
MANHNVNRDSKKFLYGFVITGMFFVYTFFALFVVYFMTGPGEVTLTPGERVIYNCVRFCAYLLTLIFLIFVSLTTGVYQLYLKIELKKDAGNNLRNQDENDSKPKSVKSSKSIKNYACKYCGKVFQNCANFTIHERTHTGERPFSCDICGEAFIKFSLLKDHGSIHA